MAQSMNLKPFYIALGVIGAAGGAWMVSGMAGSGATTIELPEIVNADAFAGYALGSDTALVEVIEYADFQCPACATFTILTVPDIKKQLVSTGRVRWRFRDFPLSGHQHSPLAHLAAACAGEQGLFWPMHDQLFYNQGTWARERRPRKLFDEYARGIGVNTKEFGACMGEQRHVDRIAATRNEGFALGVSSTPSFIVGDQLVSGVISLNQMIALVEQAEAKAAGR